MTALRRILVTGGPGSGKTGLIELPKAPVAERLAFVLERIRAA